MEIYEIKYSLTEQELNEQFEDCLDVHIVNNATIQPVPPGESVTVDVFIFFGENGVFFMAVRAIGTYGAKVIKYLTFYKFKCTRFSFHQRLTMSTS